ncbi:MAG: energy transducer TonB [Pseudomonadota bacterium]
MNPAAAGGVPYRVPPEPSRMPAMLLAAAMHAGLVAFLYIGISWQSTAPVAVEAEVWDMKVQQAAPPPEPAPVVQPEPAPAPKVEEVPPPKPPEIALEKEKPKKPPVKEKPVEKKPDPKVEKAKKAADEKKAMEKAHEAEMRRITGAVGTTGEAAKSTAPRMDSGYVASLTAKIKSNIIYTGNRDLPGDPSAIYRIEQLPTGEVLRFKQIKSSGVPDYDRAVEQAITASSPLPKKKDGTVERSIEPVFRIKD